MALPLPMLPRPPLMPGQMPPPPMGGMMPPPPMGGMMGAPGAAPMGLPPGPMPPGDPTMAPGGPPQTADEQGMIAQMLMTGQSADQLMPPGGLRPLPLVPSSGSRDPIMRRRE